MVQNVRYLNGLPSHETLAIWKPDTHDVRYSDESGIHMVIVSFFIQILFVFNLFDRLFPEFKSPVEWLKSSLSEEGDDRETEEVDGDEGVAVLPLTEECIMAMEKEQFLHVMRLLEIAPPGMITPHLYYYSAISIMN